MYFLNVESEHKCMYIHAYMKPSCFVWVKVENTVMKYSENMSLLPLNIYFVKTCSCTYRDSRFSKQAKA